VANSWEINGNFAKEKQKVRAVLESLGPLGWHHHIRSGLGEIVHAKLQNKVAYADPSGKDQLQLALNMLPAVLFELARLMGQPDPTLGTTGKVDALADLVGSLRHQSPQERTLIFVQRVALAAPLAAILERRLACRVRHVCGVQAMADSTRRLHVEEFRRGEAMILVATASLEEGLDVPDCRFVIRYDWFASAKSHVQGAGRARHRDAQVYYFENDPLVEEARRDVVETVARRGKLDALAPQQLDPTAGPPKAAQACYTPGVGEGHQWGGEATLWDYAVNASFRGAECPCGARLHIVSRAFGRGKKKKERAMSVEGSFVCTQFAAPVDPRFQGIDLETGVMPPT